MTGRALTGDAAVSAATQGLSRFFDVSPVVLLPPAIALTFALFKVDILIVIAAGIASVVPLCLCVQDMGALEVLRTALAGYMAPDASVVVVAGGGLVSMVDAVQIVCIMSAYAGIFEETPLLSGVERAVAGISTRLSGYVATLAVSVFSSVISCNQTLAIMLTHQLCRDIDCAPEEHALDLEDSVVLTAGLVPLSIAGAVPLASMGAPVASMALAAYLHAVPVWRLAAGRLESRRRSLELGGSHGRGRVAGALPPEVSGKI